MKKDIKLYKIFAKIKENKMFGYLSSEARIKISYRLRTGLELNLENPKTYNEKLQWLKLYWKDPLANKCADKYEVRNYVDKTIGNGYLNDIIEVYNSVEEIKIDSLPNKFVLKGTHGSGFNVIVKDKNNHNWDQEFIKMKKWLKTDYSLKNEEWVYSNLKPRVIAENYIASNTEGELQDYRFFCFNGEPKFISVDFSITNKSNTRRNIYDLDWNLLDVEIHYPRETKIKISKPEKFNEMINLAKKLSKPFPHVRVDFFYYKNKIIFGELTFFHQSGMANIKPNSFNLEMGNWLELPKKEGKI